MQENEGVTRESLVQGTKRFVSHASHMRWKKQRSISPQSEQKGSETFQPFTLSPHHTTRPSTFRASETALPALCVCAEAASNSADIAMYKEALKSDLALEMRAQPKLTVIEEESKDVQECARHSPRADANPNMLGAVSMPVPTKIMSTIIEISPENYRCEGTGTFLDKYQIMCKLDHGTYGEVSKIKEVGSGAIRALKSMSKVKCQMTDTFVDEIRILKKLVSVAAS